MELNDQSFRVFQLAAQGFCCSQIIVMLALEKEEKENPDLVRAMNGMCGGIGFSGRSCGILIGGICVLGLYGGKGTSLEYKKEAYSPMVQAYVDWFETEFESTECMDIVGYQVIDSTTGAESYPVKCGESLLKSYDQIKYILEQYDFQLGERGEA